LLTLLLIYLFIRTPIFAPGYDYEVFAVDLEQVSALAFDANGDLYATLEQRHGQGRLMHISQGQTSQILDGLEKPDGILLRGNTLFITNETEGESFAVYEYGKLRYLSGIHSAEGIAATADGRILVVEDRKQQGRLLRIDPLTSAVEVLVDDLIEAEGVCQSATGDIYYVEKTSDRLARYRDGQVTTAIAGLHNPAYLNCLQDGSILITEDRVNFGRLLRYRNGEIEVLARHLRAPQSVIVGSDGAYYLAEQRRNRILRIHEC